MRSIIISTSFWKERVQILVGKNIENLEVCWENVYNILLRYIDHPHPNANQFISGYSEIDHTNCLYILNKYGCKREDTCSNISNMLSNPNYFKNIEEILNRTKEFPIFNNTTLEFCLLAGYEDIAMLLLSHNRIDISTIDQEELFDNVTYALSKDSRLLYEILSNLDTNITFNNLAFMWSLDSENFDIIYILLYLGKVDMNLVDQEILYTFSISNRCYENNKFYIPECEKDSLFAEILKMLSNYPNVITRVANLVNNVIFC
jgi:hypothetical protein